jgi:hypothetical protein
MLTLTAYGTVPYGTVPRGIYLAALIYLSVFGEVFSVYSYYACTVMWIMLRNGTLSYWYGVLYMIVVRIYHSTYILTLFPYDTVRYGTIPIPIHFGVVLRYMYGTCTIKLTIRLTV